MAKKKDFIPNTVAGRRDFAINLANAIQPDPVKYGLTTDQYDELHAAATDYSLKISENQAAQDEAQAATAARRTSGKNLVKVIRKDVRIIQSLPGITPQLLEAAGLPVHDTIHTPRNVHQPQDLTAEGTPQDESILDWDAGENFPGTLYQIEAQKDVNVGFVMIDVVTKTKYHHKGQTPGVRVDYRVRAKRDGEVSIPSNVATVYPDGVSQ